MPEDEVSETGERRRTSNSSTLEPELELPLFEFDWADMVG